MHQCVGGNTVHLVTLVSTHCAQPLPNPALPGQLHSLRLHWQSLILTHRASVPSTIIVEGELEYWACSRLEAALATIQRVALVWLHRCHRSFGCCGHALLWAYSEGGKYSSTYLPCCMYYMATGSDNGNPQRQPSNLQNV